MKIAFKEARARGPCGCGAGVLGFEREIERRMKMVGRKLKVVEIPMSAMTLLPAKPGTCPECAVKHDPQLPHNRDSLYYQVKFKMANGRHPTWNDAMAHCTDEMKARWREAFAKYMKEKDSDHA